MVRTLTEANFQQEALTGDVPVLVDFWGPTCPPCRRLLPVLDELAAEAGGRYRVGKVDAFAEPDLAARFGISVVPTLLLFHRGRVVRSLVGYHDKAALANALSLG